MQHDVFISYSSKDKATADAVCAKLEERAIRCWIAPRDILPGADWSSSIIDAISGARAMVLVFSGNANASQQIKREVERALNRSIPVIPLRIENVAPAKSLEYFLSTPHWLDAYTPPLDDHLKYLGDVIRNILDGSTVPERPPPPKPPWWRGRFGLAAGAAVVVALAVAGWLLFDRPPPDFTGTWTATALDGRQFSTEDALTSGFVPPQLLNNMWSNPKTKGVLKIDPSGQFTLTIDGEDDGTVSANPADATGQPYTALTFVSAATGQSLTVNASLFGGPANGSLSGFNPATSPPPDGQTLFGLIFMPDGQTSGASIGDLSGKPNDQGGPDADGNFRFLDLIAATWSPAVAGIVDYNNNDPNNKVSVSLTITAGGHYRLNYTLHEKSLWHAANGTWSRDIPPFTAQPESGTTDGGTYTFTTNDLVTLYDQSASSTWRRGS